MKWWHISIWRAIEHAAHRTRELGALTLFGACMFASHSAHAACLQVQAAKDSAVVVRSDSGTTVTLSDSLIRQLAGQLGMIDSLEARRCYALQGCKTHLADSAAHIYTRYERHREKRIRGWAKLIPEQSTLQFAGSIGLLSAGFGWHYGRGDHWETELLVGFLPRYHSESVKTTFTLKQRYVPWHCVLSKRWTVEPLTAGLFFNTISGEDFWKNQPDRYPKNYYGFSTKVRTNIFLGQRLRYSIPSKRRIFVRAVSLYYELSSCDLYIVSKATNKDYPWSETLSLALGLRWEL